jgi:hypothetical protein
MLLHTGANIVLGFLVGLGISVAAVSISILHRGKLYRRLNPETRPRRWVLISLLFLLAVFMVWFPVWMIWPHALISRVLTRLFGITFFVVAIAIKRFSSMVDGHIRRRGWPLR